MRIDLSTCHLRCWDDTDAEALARHANDHEIWKHLRDFFPHPYTIGDAQAYLARMASQAASPRSMAIVVDGEPCGGISATIQDDVHRLTAEIGYWLGRNYWGRGIMTEVVRGFADYLFATFPLERIFAVPFANHPASAKVLLKGGFELEGTMKRSAIKEGIVLDQWLFAKLRS